ncbi:MAG: ROK family protein [Clostridia bacterium]|nr:ROK family protein [Clostridia bacterium]
MKIGIDIGGTKCAVVLGDQSGIKNKIRFSTTTCEETLARIMDAVGAIGTGDAIGVSCGGPLDASRGLILSPPNLPGWDEIPICEMLTSRFGIPARLCNDADACALAEWRFGAGKGTQHMIFLTFGTGMGAGLILGGRLYSGASGMAGEIGHIRMDQNGPVGYGKRGSFEGFCSGGGIAQLGQTLATEILQTGGTLPYCKSRADLPQITAKLLAEQAAAGEPTALEVWRLCGEKLGAGLSILVDLLNPEAIVIGSIFERAEALLRPHMERVLMRETLSYAREKCRILPAALGDSIGDYAALAVASQI